MSANPLVQTIAESLRCQLARHGYYLTEAELLDTSRNLAQATMTDDLDERAQLLRVFDSFADCSLAKNVPFQLHERKGITIATLYTWAASRNLPVVVVTNDRGHVSHEVAVGDDGFTKIVVHEPFVASVNLMPTRGMGMTKKQRAEVVELLRCAADAVQYDVFPRLRALYHFGLNTSSPQYGLMVRACESLGNEYTRDQEQLLEAAARVEEGWTP